MPEDYFKPESPLYQDVWARYKSSDNYNNIEIEVAAKKAFNRTMRLFGFSGHLLITLTLKKYLTLILMN
jgi:hypothetical protein